MKKSKGSRQLPGDGFGRKRAKKFDASLRNIELPSIEQQNEKILEKARKLGLIGIQWVCEDDCLREIRGELLPYEIQAIRCPDPDKKDWLRLKGITARGGRILMGATMDLAPGDSLIIDTVEVSLGIVRVPEEKRMSN
jgi:hypothetical protein